MPEDWKLALRMTRAWAGTDEPGRCQGMGGRNVGTRKSQIYASSVMLPTEGPVWAA